MTVGALRLQELAARLRSRLGTSTRATKKVNLAGQPSECNRTPRTMTVGALRRLQELAARLRSRLGTSTRATKKANLAGQPSECNRTLRHFERTRFGGTPRQPQDSHDKSAAKEEGCGHGIVVQPAANTG
jgi:hypothetical protein